MRTFNYFTKRNFPLLIYFIIILVLSLIFISLVNKYVQPKLDMSSIYDSFDEYKIISLDSKTITKSNGRSYSVEWSNNQTPFYIQLFDQPFNSPPSKLYHTIAAIPKDSKKIQIDLKMAGTKGIKAAIFLMFYDEEKRVFSKISDINFVNPKNPSKDNTNRVESYSFTSKLSDEYKYFKVAIKIYPVNGVEGVLKLQDLDVIYK